MILQCLIVDDEPPAHRLLESYLAQLDRLQLAGNCYNAVEALNFLHQTPVDILFLDINMPELSGLEMLRTLAQPPAVILTTAYSEFALESYEIGVVDYLLKPIRFDRFLKATNRVVAQRGTDTPPATPAPLTPPPPEPFFFVKADGTQHKVWYRELHYLEAKGNFVQLHLPDQRLLTADTLSKMHQKLADHGFLRVHKSYVVNLKKVRALRGNQLLLEGDLKIPIGNSYRQIVLGKIGV